MSLTSESWPKIFKRIVSIEKKNSQASQLKLQRFELVAGSNSFNQDSNSKGYNLICEIKKKKSILEWRCLFFKMYLKKSNAKIRCFRSCETFFFQFVI